MQILVKNFIKNINFLSIIWNRKFLKLFIFFNFQFFLKKKKKSTYLLYKSMKVAQKRREGMDDGAHLSHDTM